jgi:hypothetical protein
MVAKRNSFLVLQNLSNLRKFGNETSKIIKTIPIIFYWSKTTLYREGIREGKQKAKEIIAIELYKMGLDLLQISKATDLTVDRLRKILK